MNNYKLNLENSEALLARQLPTDKVEKILNLLTQQPITGKYIREEASKRELKVKYSHGFLSVSPSTQKKVNGRWRWDLKFIPSSLVPHQ